MDNVKHLFWTKPGLKTLGEIIYKSRKTKGLSLSSACELIRSKTGIRPADTTLNAIEKGHSKPEWDTLVAIAAAEFVEFNGRKLNIFDFIYIASECEDTNMKALAALIQDHLVKNSISLEDFARITEVSLADLQTIMRGDRLAGDIYDQETVFILLAGHLTNPLTGRRFHSYLELTDYCGMRQDPTGWKQDHLSSQNGYTNCTNL